MQNHPGVHGDLAGAAGAAGISLPVLLGPHCCSVGALQATAAQILTRAFSILQPIFK